MTYQTIQYLIMDGQDERRDLPAQPTLEAATSVADHAHRALERINPSALITMVFEVPEADASWHLVYVIAPLNQEYMPKFRRGGVHA